MLKVANIPEKVKPVFGEFRDEFTEPSYESFTQLTSAVINSEKRRTVKRMHESISNGKSRTAYEYFFNEAKWDEDSVAQRKADYFFEQFGVEEGDRIYLSIDDTFREKKGDKTEGVGKFYDHSEGEYIHGNQFVTSTLQAGDAFIPHKARMYLKEDAAEEMGEEFRTKLEIAFREIIEPLEVPQKTDLYVLFDSWYYSSDLIKDIKDQNYEVVCRLKKDKKIVLNGEETNVSDLAEDLDYSEIDIEVRGKEKKYLASELKIKIPEVGEVKLVVSKKGKGKDPHYLISTDLDLSCEEIVEIYENRWSVETMHREGNQKFGFKDYQMQSKEAIERFMQIAFLAWTIVMIASTMNKDLETVIKEMKIGEYLDETKFTYFIEAIVAIQEIVKTSSSREELASRLSIYFRT